MLAPVLTASFAAVRSAAPAMAAAYDAGAQPVSTQTIFVTPGSAHPGQKIHISVPDCGVGSTPHIATSAAFARNITLYGKSDTGEGDPTIKKDLAPGTYPITATCEPGQTAHGQVVVAVAHPTATASPATAGGGSTSIAFWALGTAMLVIAACAGILLARARSRT